MNKKETNIHATPEAILNTASAWVAKLDAGELSKAERAELVQWLQSDSCHREALASQLRQWTDMDILSELTFLDVKEESTSLIARMQKPLQMNWMKKGVAALTVTLFVILALFGMNLIGSATEHEWIIETAVGEQKVESLPDGSIVHVNTISSAHINYSRNERSVVLRSGEAFFDVVSQVDRPFVVYAADTTVRAIGTAFSVYNNQGTISVSVTEGSVEFVSGGDRQIISASEQGAARQTSGNVATYRDQTTQVNTEAPSELARRLSWQDGMLEFRGESLEVVVQQLSRYTNAEIVIVDDDIKDIRLGGYFKIGDIEGLASTLALGFNIQVDVVSDDLIQVSRGESN